MAASPDLQSEAAHRNARRLARAGRRLIQDLAAIRADRDYTATAVAEAIGIHRSGVSRFENQEADPRLDTILRYAHAVNAMVSIHVERAEDYEKRQASRTPIDLSFSVNKDPASSRSADDTWDSQTVKMVSVWPSH